MAQEIINVGAAPNDGTGDTVRAAAIKSNNNFTELYSGAFFGAGSAATPSIAFSADTDTGIFRPGVNTLAVATGGIEQVRITAAGNVGIGTTAPNSTLAVNGDLELTVGGNRRLRIGTQTNYFYDIKGNGDDLNIVAGDISSVLVVRYPSFSVGPGVDNSQNLGTASLRWATVFAATGTINTSDEREKTWRGALTDAELRAANRIAKEIGIFQWNDSIAKKGADGARLHVGVRAQAVWAIMAEEKLVDSINKNGKSGATPYAFLCWDSWDDVLVPVTEDVYVPAVVNDEGGIIDAERIEQRPTGKMEISTPAGDRFGIRIDQLTLFIVAAQEQRLAALEAK
jgi:hypothetical protein